MASTFNFAFKAGPPPSCRKGFTPFSDASQIKNLSVFRRHIFISNSTGRVIKICEKRWRKNAGNDVLKMRGDTSERGKKPAYLSVIRENFGFLEFLTKKKSCYMVCGENRALSNTRTIQIYRGNYIQSRCFYLDA